MKDYLDQMRGLTIEDIISNATQITGKKGATRNIETAPAPESSQASPKTVRGGGGGVTPNNLSAQRIVEETK